MSLTLPPAKNYQSPLIAVPSRLLRSPPDGPRSVAMEFDWTTMGTTTGSQTAVFVNMANNATLKFSQILSLKVDNSQCGCDVQFVFLDTQETVLIPAYTPCAIIPVFTDMTQFYAIAQGAILSNDVTRVQALNFVPPPVTVPTSTEQQFPAVSGMTMTNGPTSKQLVATTISGTLEILQLSATIFTAPSANSTAFITIQDGSGTPVNLIQGLEISMAPTSPLVMGQIFVNLANLNFRFVNGLKMLWTVAPTWDAVGAVNAITAYRTP